MREIRKEADELLASIRQEVLEFEKDIQDELVLLGMLAGHF